MTKTRSFPAWQPDGDEATAAIEGAGFELGKVEESFDDKVESGG